MTVTFEEQRIKNLGWNGHTKGIMPRLEKYNNHNTNNNIIFRPMCPAYAITALFFLGQMYISTRLASRPNGRIRRRNMTFLLTATCINSNLCGGFKAEPR